MHRARAALVLLTALGLTSCTSGGDAGPEQERFRPAAAPAVSLPLLEDQTEPLRLGVVVSGTAGRGQGAEYAALAAGARVAEFRLDAGQDRLALEVVDDRGTPEGGRAAVEELVASGVAGIVYASAGTHVDPALQAAAAAGTAVLLPYETRLAAAAATTWRTGPDDDQVAERVRELLAERGQSAPLVLSGEGAGGALDALAAPARRTTLAAGSGLAPRVTAAVTTQTKGGGDALVVAASAETTAEVVAALQAQAATAPVVLGPSALAPAFPTRLSALGSAGAATTAGQFFTVGPAATDASAEPGVLAFLAALRLAAQDTGVLALQGGDDTFSRAGAATADVRSHDAVLALATAAAAAPSTAPADVLAALRPLVLDGDDGLAGAPLAFADAQALDPQDVVVLQATTRGAERSGVEQAAPALSWFPVASG